MSTDAKNMVEPYQLSIQQLGAVLLKHYGLHEGKYQLSVGFKIGVGSVPSGEEDTETIPGAIVGVEGVMLTREPDDAQSPNILDAAVLNPKKKPRSKKTEASES